MKRFYKGLIVALVIVMVCSLTLTGCGRKSGEQLKVGMECAYAPFNWTQTDDSNGAVPIEGGGYAGGYDVEIAKRVAAGLGKELVIVKTEWSGLPPSVTSGKIDLIIAGMSATSERKQTIDFTDDYYTSDLVVVLRKDSPYANAKSVDEFSGAKITGQLSTVHYDVIDQMDGVDKQAAVDTFPTMIVAVQSGKIDGYVSERPGAISAATANPDLTFVEFESGKGFDFSGEEVSIAIGLKQGSPLKEEINKVLAGISEEERAQLMVDAVKHQPASE